MPKPVNPEVTRSITWLLLPWLFVFPGHQQPWYLLYRINVHSSSMRKDFNYLCDLSEKKWQQMQKYFNVSSKQFGIMTIQPYFCKNFRIFDSDLTSRPARAGLRPPRRISSWKTLTTTSGVLIRIRSWKKKLMTFSRWIKQDAVYTCTLIFWSYVTSKKIYDLKSEYFWYPTFIHDTISPRHLILPGHQ